MKSLANEFFKELLDYNTDSWRGQAACKDMDVNIFFNDLGDGQQDKSRLRVALEACESCSVVDECLQFAQKNNLIHGIYGGSRYVKNRRRWVNLLEERK